MTYFLKYFLCSILTILISGITAQVNGYASVVSYTNNSINISLNAVDESFGSFEDGDKIYVYQTQMYGGNAYSNPQGTLTTSNVYAGTMEVATIASHTEVNGIPTSLTLTGPLVNFYASNSTNRIQVVTFPTLGTGNYTTTADIRAIPWNGDFGGIVTFNVTDTLILAHNIDANDAGFRGGGMSDSTISTTCYSTTYTSNTGFGLKGEGIAAYYNSNSMRGRGRWSNGAGSGNMQYGPGGGGSNWGSGGYGIGIFCPYTGGYGGQDLQSFIQFVWPIQGSRFFMGGGGGGGAHREATPTGVGGNGGGIVYVKAASIRTTAGPCGGRFIQANGGDGGHVTGPPIGGGGGGGGGGSIFLEIPHWQVDSTVCPIICTANGGDGGCYADTSGGGITVIYGGGGGGSQGAVGCSGGAGSGSAGAIASTGAGTGGPGDTNGGSGSGPNNAGVAGFGNGGVGQLPIELLYFSATPKENTVALEWATASEIDNDHFVVHRSRDANSWEPILTVSGALNSSSTITYSSTDPLPLTGQSYYMLEQVDVDGTNSFSNMVPVNFAEASTATSFVELSKARVSVLAPALSGSSIELFDMQGRMLVKRLARNNSVQIQSPYAIMGQVILKINYPSGRVEYSRPTIRN